MKIDFLIAQHNNNRNIEEELNGVIKSFKNALKKQNIELKQFIRLVVFYNPNCSNNFLLVIKQKLSEYFKLNIPISYVSQPPQKGQNIIIEASYVSDKDARIQHFSFGEINYAKANLDSEEHLFISGIQSSDRDFKIQDYAEYSFNALKNILENERFSFTDIVRQWNYIEGILDHENGNQNYQVFNDVRTKYYTENRLVSRYPAATGIGMKEGGIIIDIHALRDHGILQLAELANPLQTDAYEYSGSVLEGEPLEGMGCKTTPKFSRAKLIVNSKVAQVLVSGTASIKGEDTIGLDNVEKQTNNTIQNILELIEPKLLGSFNSACKNASLTISNLRVYVKKQIYIEAVRHICEQEFKTDNIIFVEADICRDNLLVEIEGVISLTLAK